MSAINKIDLGIIRYANCWEDADILIESLSKRQFNNIACVASAGDNAIALLTLGCNVTAFDVSLVQLYLTELKKAAFTELQYGEVLTFLGIRGTETERNTLFHRLLPHLSEGARSHWKEHDKIVLKGIIYQGRFENYFRMFRNIFLPLTHNTKTIHRLLQPKSAVEQEEFYWKKWNTSRWKWLMRMFFSKWVMGRYGRDPELMKHIDIPVHEFIMRKASSHLQSVYATQNHMLQMIFTGSFTHNLPFFLRKENFDAIRSNIHRLQILHSSAEQIIRTQEFDAHCLSNIFEYYSAEDFKKTVAGWSDQLPKGVLLAYWNLMAPRSFSNIDDINFKEIDTSLLTVKDKGFFYSRFWLEEKI